MKGTLRTLDDWPVDIDEMAGKILLHTKDLSKSDFDANEPIKDLAAKKIENIGEAVKQITRKFPEYAEAPRTATE